MDKKSKIITGAVVACLLIVLGFVFSQTYLTDKKDNEQPLNSLNTQTNDVLEENQNTNTKKIVQPNPKPADLTYKETVDKYGDFRVQIDNCSVPKPTMITVKNGTSVMFDNRSADDIELTVNKKIYQVSGYDYKIILLSNKTLPYSVQVDCRSGDDMGKNIAQILLQ